MTRTHASGINLISTYHFTVQSLRKYPALFIPFLITLGLQLAALAFILIAPRAPFDSILAPIIRAFWGEKFLHYPTHFLLFPLLAYQSQFIISISYGPLMAGWAALLVKSAYDGQKPVETEAFLQSARKYILTFIIIVITYAAVYSISAGIALGLKLYFKTGHTTLLQLPAGLWNGPLTVLINFVITLIVQASLVFSIPLVVLKRNRVMQALRGSISLYKKTLALTTLLVALPLSLYTPILILLYKAPTMFAKTFPEALAIVCLLGAIVNSLFVDVLITVGTLFLFLRINGEENA